MSVIVALSRNVFIDAILLESVVFGATPFAQTISSSFQTLIVSGFSPPSSFTLSAVVAFLVTLITALALSVEPSEYFTTTGISTAFPASTSTGV